MTDKPMMKRHVRMQAFLEDWIRRDLEPFRNKFDAQAAKSQVRDVVRAFLEKMILSGEVPSPIEVTVLDQDRHDVERGIFRLGFKIDRTWYERLPRDVKDELKALMNMRIP